MDVALQDFKAWYVKLQPFSRTYLTVGFTLTILGSLQLVGFMSLIMHWSLLLEFELWRVLTAYAIFGKLSINLLFKMWSVYFSVSKTESLFGQHNYHDFVFLVLVVWLISIPFCLMLEVVICTNVLTLAILYIWCKRVPDVDVYFYFGLKIRSVYFCWVLALLYALQNQFSASIIGIASGHCFYFVKDILSIKNGKDYLATPDFIKRIVAYFTGAGQGHHNNFGGRQGQQAPPPPRFFQGRGMHMQ